MDKTLIYFLFTGILLIHSGLRAREQGNLWLLLVETVDTEHLQDYWKWSQEQKKVAEKTAFKPYLVSTNDKGKFRNKFLPHVRQFKENEVYPVNALTHKAEQ